MRSHAANLHAQTDSQLIHDYAKAIFDHCVPAANNALTYACTNWLSPVQCPLCQLEHLEIDIAFRVCIDSQAGATGDGARGGGGGGRGARWRQSPALTHAEIQIYRAIIHIQTCANRGAWDATRQGGRVDS